MHPFNYHKTNSFSVALLFCMMVQCRPSNEHRVELKQGMNVDTFNSQPAIPPMDSLDNIATAHKTALTKEPLATLPPEGRARPSNPQAVSIEPATEARPSVEEEARPVKKDPVMKQDDEVLPTKKTEKNLSPESDFVLWDAFLRKYVSADGRVMYKQIKRDMATLDAILLEWQKKQVPPTWSREEKFAFWINVYNAFTIKKVASNYPIKSIMDLDKGKTWDIAFIDIGQKKYSLNDIENEMLRKPFNDARIHFALNCAAKSCPPLLARAYTPTQLSVQLDERTRAFLSNPSFNTLEADKAEVSRIFEWYALDFAPLSAFLSRYGPIKLKPGIKVNYKPYNWALNE